MEIEYKRLSEKELDVFIEMRINQLREEGAKEDLDLKPALQDYYKRHMKDGTFVSWIAVDDGRIIGTSGMSFVEKPPYFACPSGKMGLLSACLLTQTIDEKELQRSFYIELSKKPEIMDAEPYRLLRPIWV